MTKTITKLMLALTTLAATGCAAPAPLAAPAAAARQADAPAPMRRLMATAGKTIDQTAASGPAVVRPWALYFSGARYQDDALVPATPEYAHLSGSLSTKYPGYMWVERFWEAGFNYSGDGQLTYMGEQRFAYRVPQGRLLVLNRQTGHFSVDGVPMGSDIELANWNNQASQAVPSALDIMVAPGSLVVFTLGEQVTISGYTCDPVVRGLPGAGGEAGAAPNSGK